MLAADGRTLMEPEGAGKMNPIQQLKEEIDQQGPDDAVTLSADATRRDPFTPAPDKAFFYAEPTRAQRLKLLHHLAPYGELLIVTGEIGSGKTTLMEQFVDRAHESWRLCVIAAGSGLGKGRFLDALIDGFSIQVKRPENTDDKLQVLKGHCASLKRSGLLPIVVIDDAHQLGRDDLSLSLRLLQSLDDHEKPLRIILFAAPQLRETISTPELAGLQERITHTFNLLPLSEKETANYINHRLQVAGVSGDGLFTETVVKMIHRTSQGLPGKINELARVVLANRSHAKAGKAEALLSAKGLGKGGRVWNALPLGIALGILGLLVIYYFNKSAPPTGVEDRIARTDTSQQEQVPLTLPANKAAESPRPVSDAPAPPTATDHTPPPAPAASETPSPVAMADTGKPAPAVIPAAPPAARATPPPPVSVPEEAPPPPAAPSAAAPAPAKPAPTVVKPKAVNTPPKPVATAHPAAAGTAKDAAWVMAQDPAHFTLQLMATKQPDTVDQVLRRGGVDPGEFARFQAVSRGETWHVLAYGLYPNRTAAAAEAAHLPGALHGFKPWIRPVGDVQAAIKQYQDLHP
jgi:DamX protein